MSSAARRAWKATFMFPNQDVELPIHPEEVPRLGDQILWTSQGQIEGEFAVTQVCWHVDEHEGVRRVVDVSVDPIDVPREGEA